MTEPNKTEAPQLPLVATAPDANLLEFKGSSNITSAKLDPATGIVAVLFANEKSYRYSGFTAALMREWSEAKSPGNWFHTNVRQHPEVHPVIGDDGKPVKQAAPAVVAPVAAAPAPVAPPAPPTIANNTFREGTSKREKQWWKDRPWKKKP